MVVVGELALALTVPLPAKLDTSVNKFKSYIQGAVIRPKVQVSPVCCTVASEQETTSTDAPISLCGC